MAIKNGDFVRLEFTGKIKETGDIFDTTSEEVALEAGIFVENKDYGPIPIIIGGNHLLKAIDEAVIGLEKGDTKEIEVTPENGFGKRDTSLIQLVPMKEFKKQGMNPYVGMELNSDGNKGRVLTINGGRVKVDFNHELAGKNLEYSVVITDIIEDDEEKIKSMIQLHYSYPNMDLDKTEIKIDSDKVSIKLDEITRFDQKSYMDVTFARFRISKDIWDHMDFEKVEFVDEFEKKVEEDLDSDESVAANSDESLNTNSDESVNDSENKVEETSESSDE
ncbi:FKBP-type peptidyl-prolyl cis-trans isomerase SlyD [Methanobrevibacter cuticularis]|uniref:Peptidyl-prolyl cis-trans isomerase n=1 Tax=Methanobrevibacter cuticularis TaxID=47311 RepID=A0A166F332_9EURY|nr:peptidylprolyl isomerase [Methanobrevibacter cuticularis]KZX17268.1 FKBP-type peptidyl-prolyl cis-trans isomerase SlyD [Methanobrevibacter cuticularis]